jgi:hypothetical protein
LEDTSRDACNEQRADLRNQATGNKQTGVTVFSNPGRRYSMQLNKSNLDCFFCYAFWDKQ